MDFRRLSISVGLISCLTFAGAGCRSHSDTVYETWSEKTSPFVPSSRSENAFDAYALAAQELDLAAARYQLFRQQEIKALAKKREQKSKKPLSPEAREALEKLPTLITEEVSFTADGAKEALKVCLPAFRILIDSMSKKADFQFRARNLYDDAPFVRSWRLLGRCFVWEMRTAIEAGDYGTAIRYCLLGSRFGFDLTAGGALEVSLGCVIVQEIRQTLSPHLQKMSASQCSALSQGMKAVLEHRPSIKLAIDNELKSMRKQVQLVQNTFLSNDYRQLGDALGLSVKEAITFLKDDLSRKDGEKRKAYFAGMAEEAAERTAEYIVNADKPTSKRVWLDYNKKIDGKPPRVRPWKRFATQFFTAGRPMFEMYDQAIARSRLLVLESELWRRVKTVGSSPRNLDEFSREIATDPFNGVRFQYRPEGAVFRVYSVGPNGVDDGGATDDAFANPDLTLEHR